MSNIHTGSQNVNFVTSFDAVLANSTQAGTAVDCLGYTRATLLFSTWTGASTTSNFTITESDTSGGSYTAVTVTPTPVAIVASTADAGVQPVDIDLTKRKRFLKFSSVGTGTAGNACGVFCLFNAMDKAVTQAVAALSA